MKRLKSKITSIALALSIIVTALVSAAVPVSASATLTMAQLQQYLGIGDVTPAGAQTLYAYNYWNGCAKYYFVAAGFITPYLTNEQQMNNFNWVLYQTNRVDRGVTQPTDTAIKALSVAQDAAIKAGNYSSVLPPATPTITSFSASPTSVPWQGGNVVLTATLQSGTSGKITCAQLPSLQGSIGFTTGSATFTVGMPTNTSSAPVTYTFVLTVSGDPTTASATVVVAAQPPPATTFTVTASISGGGGTASPATQNVNAGGTASMSITPSAGYVIVSITDNGVQVTTANPYVINSVNTNHTVVVALIPIFTSISTPIQFSETAKSQDGNYYYAVMNVNPYNIIPQYSGYTTDLSSYNFAIMSPSNVSIYDLSLPTNIQATTANLPLELVQIWGGVAIDYASGGIPLSAIARSLYDIIQAETASGIPANVIQFSGSGIGATATVPNMTFLVVYKSTTSVQNITLNISAAETWSYALSTTPSHTIVNPPAPGGSYGPVQTTITLP